MNRFYRLIATLIPRRLYGIPAPAPAAHQLTSTLIPTTLYTRVDLNRPLAADHLTSTLIPRRLYGILAPAAAAAHQLTSTGNSEVRDFSTRPRKSKERSLRYKSHRGQFPCYSCTLIFHYEPPLREHYNNIHPEVVKLGFGCSCGAFFLDMFELRKHITLGQCPYDGKNETRKLKDFRLVEKWRKRQATEEKEEERKSLLGYEGLEVINPEGGIEDAEVEAEKGRWRQEDRDTFWKMMQNCIGYDVTSMATLPVLIFEPMTMLQKMAELMEYSYLLELADECEDRHMGLVYAAAWFVSLYYAIQRTWKPFNPVLGETYEMVNHNGITFIAEQVSHHPPMSAAHAENEHFIYDVTSKLKTKFLGNSVDIYPVGRTRLTLKKSGVVLDLVPPPSKAYNIIFGRTWVDSPGDMVLTNLTTGDKVVLNFQPCGWFGAGRYEVDGFVYNAEEEPTFFMAGKWNEFMSYQPCDSEGEPLAGCELKEVWRVADAPKNDKFQYTHFAHKLNSFDTAPKMLLPSDSRLRPDRLALEHGDLSKAGAEKSRLQDRQRLERRTRKARHHEFKPKWFDLTTETASTPWGDLEIYQYNGEYAKHRAAIDNLDKAEETETNPTEFNPWRQYQDLPASQS